MKCMKQILLSLFLVFFACAAIGQQDTLKSVIVSPKLMNVKDAFFLSFLTDELYWSLYMEYSDKKYSATKADDIMSYVDSYLSVTPTINKKQGQIKEFGLITKYRNDIDSIFKGMRLFGSDQIGEFLFNKETSLPLRFVLYGDTALSFIVTGVSIDKVYNTIKLTGRQRATKVLTTYILPSLKSFVKSFSSKEIRFFGMTCVYGSKDFTDDSPLSTKPEFVAFIAPAKLIRQYVTNDITEDELINGADVFVSDRDMVSDMKKIKITLE